MTQIHDPHFADALVPEKLALLAGELLRDLGETPADVRSVARALGQALACAQILDDAAPLDPGAFMALLDHAEDAAMEFHDRFAASVAAGADPG